MKINDITQVGKSSSVSKKKNKSNDVVFDSLLEGSENEAEESSISAIGSLSSMDALIAAQAINSSFAQKEKQVKRGNDILDYLEKLRIGMLSGDISPAIVSNIVNEIKYKYKNSDDKVLEDIISEIELRAEIEIAKLMNPNSG